MSAPILIHVLSLDTVGGVEALYVHYLREALSRGMAIHYTCVTGRRPHEKFSEMLQSHEHKPFLEEYIMGLRLPNILKSIIHFRRGLIQDLVKPTAWVFWNRIEEKIPPGRYIYYEHGASWTLSPTKKRKEFLRKSASFIANSEAASIMLKKRWDVSSPITVIPNPLRPDISLSPHPRKRASCAPLRLGFIGRLVPIKGPLIPLHVVKALHDKKIHTTLSIAGGGFEEASMKHAAKKMGIESSVHFCGCVSDIEKWFDSIDILLVPSIREPLGLVSLEAAARGVPVIAADVDGLPEVVSHEHTGLLIEPKIPLRQAGSLMADTSGLPDVVVQPKLQELVEPKLIDPEDCVKAIYRFMNNPAFYEQCSTQALLKAQERSYFGTYYESLKSILENDPDVIES